MCNNFLIFAFTPEILNQIPTIHLNMWIDQSTIFQLLAHHLIVDLSCWNIADIYHSHCRHVKRGPTLRMYVPNNVIIFQIFKFFTTFEEKLYALVMFYFQWCTNSTATTFTLLPSIVKLKFALHHQCVRISMCAIHIPRYVKWYMQWTESMEAYKISKSNWTNIMQLVCLISGRWW